MPHAFAPVPSHPSTAPLFAGAALLDAEKLDAYRVALEFQTLAAQLVPKRGYAELRDQLGRASISIVLNTAEGCGRRSPADKARFYSMARGSATECDAILDLLGARGLIDDRLRSRARALLVRIVQMLSRLVALTKVLTDLTQCDRCSRAECGWGRRWGRALCSCGCSSLR